MSRDMLKRPLARSDLDRCDRQGDGDAVLRGPRQPHKHKDPKTDSGNHHL